MEAPVVVRAPRLIASVVALALVAAMLGPAASATPAFSATLATFRSMVQRAEAAAWAAHGPDTLGARANVLVELEAAPLAALARDTAPADLAAYSDAVASAQGRLASMIAANGGQVLARFNTVAAGLAANIPVDQISALRAHPDVLAVLPIADYALAQGPAAEPVSLDQVNTLIGSNILQRRGADGAGIDVAVVDSGVDYTHRRLGGPATPDAYYRAFCGGAALRPGDPSCDPSLPPPADLFPNAVVRGGYDYLGDIWPAPDPRCPDTDVCIFPDPNPIDGAGHGTHVADIVAGRPGPDGANPGVAPGASLWAFKACNGGASRCEGSALLLAIDHAMDLDGSNRGRCRADLGDTCAAYDPADVIVLAVSYRYGQPEDALTLFADLAGFYGSLVVAAAGNDGDRPFIVGTPAVASASLAVAESTLAPGGSPAEAPAPGASRGPRIADGALKPDIAAPGAIVSAAAGTGSGLAPFGGSSGAAPVVAGAAALVIQELERLGGVDPEPGLRDRAAGSLSLAPLVKALLMNTAAPIGADGSPAPASLVGSGRVDALTAFRTRTLAIDASAISELFAADETLRLCSITPYTDLISYLFFDRLPPCARAYPGGDTLMRAWNAQTGSISFGYRPVSEAVEIRRTVAIINISRFPRSYRLSATSAGTPGVSVELSHRELDLPGNGVATVELTLRLDPRALPAAPAAGQLLEAQGSVVIDGGPYNRIALPWHVMPERVADVVLARATESNAVLRNQAPAQAAAGEAFALVDLSPNQCDVRDALGAIAMACPSVDYRPGDRPGSGSSPPDLAAAGVRGRSVPGLNAALGLPPAPAGATPDELVEFAVTLHDQPFRATPLSPVRLEVVIDADRDGAADYRVTSDADGAILIRDANPAGGTEPDRQLGALDAGYHTRWWILPVPAAAVGLRSDQPFHFAIRAYDARFGDQLWDCSPGGLAGCGAAAHTFQTGAPLFAPAVSSFTVPAAGRYTLRWDELPADDSSQIGLLLLLRGSAPAASAIELRLR